VNYKQVLVDHIVAQTVATVISSERFFAIAESPYSALPDLYDDLFERGLVDLIDKPNGQTELNRLNRSYYDLLARILTYHLAPLGIHLVAIPWKGEYLHSYRRYFSPEKGVSKVFSDFIKDWCDKCSTRRGHVNVGGRQVPPRLIGTSVRKLTIKITKKDPTSLATAFTKEKVDLELFVFKRADEDVSVIKTICENVFERVEFIRNKFSILWQWIVVHEGTKHYDEVVEGRPENYLIDRLLCLVLATVSKHESLNEYDLTHPYFQEIFYDPGKKRFWTRYRLAYHQIKGLVEEGKLKPDEVALLSVKSYPTTSYTPAVIYAGLGGPIGEWTEESFGEDYPTDLLKVESKLWDKTDYKGYLLPLSEFGENRFAVTLRLLHLWKPERIDFAIAEEALKLVAKDYKSMFFDLERRDVEQALQENPDKDMSSAFTVLERLMHEEDSPASIKERATVKGIETFTDRQRNLNMQRLNSARRAAISQVMARNMSHNIGSHVLANLIKKEQIENIDKVNIFDEQCNSFQQINKKELSTEGKIDKDKAISFFNVYLKTRMDYLADIATSVPTLLVNKSMYKEILSGFDRNRLLLNYISGINQFAYRITLWDYRQGQQLEIKDNGLYPPKEDLLVAIPNDVLGCHAFYVILENLIRNTAKHGGKPDDSSEVEFKIEFRNCEADSSLYEVLIHDNCKITADSALDRKELEAWSKECNEKDAGSSVDLDTPIGRLVYKLNKRLNDGVLDRGTLRQGAWGLIEMQVSAAYLRQIAPEEVDEREFHVDVCSNNCQPNASQINIIKAVNVNGCLGYRIHLMKPSNYLIVGDFGIDQDRRKKLAEEGICVLSSNEFDPEKSVYPHPFLLYVDNDNLGAKIEDNRSALPYRVMPIDSKLKKVVEIIRDRKGNFLGLVDEIVWPQWAKSFLKKHDIAKLICSPLNDGENKFQFSTGESSGKDIDAAFPPHGEKWSDLEKNCQYVEPLSSRVKTSLPNFDFDNGTLVFRRVKDESVKSKIAEFVAMKIAIIDERIQKALDYEYKPKNQEPIKFGSIYEKTNRIVPSANEFDLNQFDFTQKRNDEDLTVKEKIERWLATNLKSLDVLIIHLGIIEKILKGADTNDTAIERYLNDRVKCHNENLLIVITSGRGQPHNLPKEERFVNVSSVTECLVDDLSKYKLTNLVLAARKLRS